MYVLTLFLNINNPHIRRKYSSKERKVTIHGAIDCLIRRRRMTFSTRRKVTYPAST